jgi:2-keto-4-pentenoate hydratase/2-oxohepta-3-ene-1,7-dioic acid hydratase in catechol pathway
MYKLTFDDGSRLTPTKIIGVGLNYAAHIEEMNNTRPSEPVLFIKPSTSLCDFNSPLVIPVDKGSVHHELELAVCIARECSAVDKDEAAGYIAGFGMALDLTLRDIQSIAKQKGRPWSVAKGFDKSCPVTTFFKKNISDVNNTLLMLKINGETRQFAKTNLMLFKIEELISYISGVFTLLPGDIILTGTPSGVGPLKSGDKIEAFIEDLVTARTEVI